MRLNRDAALGVGVVLLVAVLLVPLPPLVLALLQTVNLSIALVVLLAVLYSRDVLETSAFPSLLLFTTLFRLALNVSATRLILLKANAGPVIAAFGRFLMGSNPVVGFVTFVILIIVQFVVVTRGSERVAEVAARFTLDAMPGKQMAIDADLNAGLLNEEAARHRRRSIEQEADFYGAMDGASKFVRGDAIAGILIVLVNIVGGLLIGMLQRHMPVGQALSTYALLTVGDGLVTQVPALLLSIAAGVVVTRAAGDVSLSDALAGQVLNPRALLGGALALGVLGVVPGLPHLPFLVVSGCLLGGMWYERRRLRVVADQEQSAAQQVQVTQDTAVQVVEPALVAIRYGDALTALVLGPLMGHLRVARRELAEQLGLLVPEPELVQDHELEPQDYRIAVRGSDAGPGSLRLSQVLLLETGAVSEPLAGEATTDPTFGVPALWVPESERVRATRAGYQVVEPATVLATHFGEVCRRQAAELLDRAACKAVLERARSRSASLVDDLVPSVLQVWQVQRVLQGLLAEGVSIRGVSRILEAMAEGAAREGGRDPDTLVEWVRQALARDVLRGALVRPALSGGRLRCVLLDPVLEVEIARQVQGGAPEAGFVLSFRRALAQAMTAALRDGPCVLLCAPEIRARVRLFTRRAWARLAVLSTAEVPETVEILPVAQVEGDMATVSA